MTQYEAVKLHITGATNIKELDQAEAVLDWMYDNGQLTFREFKSLEQQVTVRYVIITGE